MCIIFNDTKLFLDIAEKSLIQLIEQDSSVFVLLNFFPCTLLAATFLILAVISFVIDRKTLIYYVMHVSLIKVEFLSTILIVIYSIIYDVKGLHVVRVLTISHLCILLGMVALNYAVQRIFNK